MNNKNWELHFTDNLEWLKKQPDNSLDSFVTDGPYGLGREPDAAECLQAWIKDGYYEVNQKGFMGRKWDAFVPQPIFWKEVYRVLKPGGYVLSFAGTRTYDWMVMAMRIAGFEIKNQLMWIFGSGFPHGQDVSKAIDKQAGAEREVVGKIDPRSVFDGKNRTSTAINTNWRTAEGRTDTHDLSQKIITVSATPEAKQWEGYATHLKPAHEPIVLAQKQIEVGLTIAQNVLKWGTGAMNIDGCRIFAGDPEKGRYPSTIIHDGSETIEL